MTCRCLEHAIAMIQAVMAAATDAKLDNECILVGLNAVSILKQHSNGCYTNDVDKLANIIRQVDGNHNLGASALAEKIIEQLEFNSKEIQP